MQNTQCYVYNYNYVEICLKTETKRTQKSENSCARKAGMWVK